MFGMLVCIGAQGGNWKLNVLKVTSVHSAGCGKSIVKTHVSAEVFFCKSCTKVIPKEVPRSRLGAIWETFVMLPAFWCALGYLLQTRGLNVDLVRFCVAASMWI